MARCYMCSGTKEILVDTWEEGELHRVPCMCVRCKGTGVISDTHVIDDITDRPVDPMDMSGVCICNYRVWGPMGDPNCPAR